MMMTSTVEVTDSITTDTSVITDVVTVMNSIEGGSVVVDTTTTTTSTSSSSTAATAVMTSKKLFVGNLHSSTSEGDIIKLFTRIGTVLHIDYIWHTSGPFRGQPRGFAFVEMSSIEEAKKAIQVLHGQVIRGRSMVVAPKEQEALQCRQAWYTQHQQSLLIKTTSKPGVGNTNKTSNTSSYLLTKVTGQKRIQEAIASNIDENIKRLKAALQQPDH